MHATRAELLGQPADAQGAREGWLPDEACTKLRARQVQQECCWASSEAAPHPQAAGAGEALDGRVAPGGQHGGALAKCEAGR
jgi:hypothetical protein